MKTTDKIRNRVRDWLGVETRLTSSEPTRPPRMGGRVSVDNEQDVFASALSFLTPMAPESETYWRDSKLDAKTLDRISPTKLMQLLADLSPEVSRALWDFLRLCNPGYEVKVFNEGSDAINKKAQDAVDTFLASLHGPYSSENAVPADVVINSLFMGAFLRGAFLAELVLDESGRAALEIATPDPSSVRFRRETEGARGPVWKMGQWQKGEFVYLDRPTIVYVPVDPFPGSPYGRSLAAPALFASLFLLGLLHDLRRVVAQQGYPRLDIAINMEKLKAAMPSSIQSDPTQAKAWADTAIEQVISTYSSLEPDEAFVHPDFVEINRPVGVVDSSSLGAVDGLITGLERMLARAVKSNALLFGLGKEVGESNSNRLWESHIAGVKSIQHPCEFVLERVLTLALRVQGIAARVQVRFAEVRAAELLRDAQVEALQIKNEREKYGAGWTTQDEAAEKITGHKAAEKKPRESASPSSTPIPTGGMAADPGSERQVKPNGDAELLSEVEQ